MACGSRWFLPLAMALGLASCSTRMPTEPLVGPPLVEPTPTEAPTDSSLAANRARWDYSGVDSYRYRFRWLCFCGYDYVRWVVITVVRGKIVSVVDAETKLPLPLEEAARYRTIEGLFDFIRSSMDYPAHQIGVSFNPALGFPSAAYVDYQAGIADEELGFSIDRLVPMWLP